VGKSRPNGWGLYDMHGNVREWCADRYAADYYSRSPGEDPTGPSFGNERVLRGGSCTADVASECRSASRFGAAPTYQDDSGFRVVCVRNAGASDPFVAMPSKPLRLLPVAPRTIGVGNELRVAVPVEDAERWEGKLRFSLDRKAPSGARVDAETGEFVWTPAEGQGPGKYDVVVSVEGPEGRRSQVSFSITVTRAHAPAEKGVTLDLGGGVTMEFVLIPAGSFLMGSPDSTGQVDDGEKPQHEVRITKPFYLGKYEVTQEQWEAVMGENPSTFKGTDNPVEQVSWEDCQEFLSRLREKLDTPWSSCRLPTEAEWEYACRAGSTKKYTFGDEDANLGDYAWFSRNAGSKTNPVGQKKPNAWGLYDMHGNVCEWCADRYGENYYSQSPEKDPTGPIFGSTHVLRGGSWTVDASSCRSAARDENSPASRGSSYGFRVVCVK
jgi:formylglycine-generating enzyme required for sulfatase activity